MNRNLSLKLSSWAAATGIVLLIAAAAAPPPPKPTPPPTVAQATEAMKQPGADRAFWQERIDAYYAAPEDVRSMKDGLIISMERDAADRLAARKWQDKQLQEQAVKFCEANPELCQ